MHSRAGDARGVGEDRTQDHIGELTDGRIGQPSLEVVLVQRDQ